MLSNRLMANRPKSKNRSAMPASQQLAFDFDDKPLLLPITTELAKSNQIVAPLKAKPTATVATFEVAPAPLSLPPSQSDGAEENRYLLHQADKYEERALKVLVLFMIFSALAIFAKSGLPISAATEKLGLSAISNVRLLVGILASAALLLAVALTYCMLRVRQHRPHLELPLLHRSWHGYIARYILVGCGILVLSVLLGVIAVSWRDVLFLATYIIDRQFYVMDGWDPIKK